MRIARTPAAQGARRAWIVDGTPLDRCRGDPDCSVVVAEVQYALRQQVHHGKVGVQAQRLLQNLPRRSGIGEPITQHLRGLAEQVYRVGRLLGGADDQARRTTAGAPAKQARAGRFPSGLESAL